MEYRIDLADRAQRDLFAIYEFIHAESSAKAFEWFRGLERLIFSLEDQPDRGTSLPGNAKLRQLLYGNKPHIYRIIYTVEKRSRTVFILHLRHGARMKGNETD